jgi:cytochrome P450
MARVAHTPIVYGPYTIPAGVPISMDTYSAHHDETLFPLSHSFIPERWLNNPRAPALGTFGSAKVEKDGRLLSRYNVVFAKGTRQCLGMHLANAELYITLATIVRRCKFEIYQTEWKDIGFVRDMFVPHPDPSSKGLRVLVKECF